MMMNLPPLKAHGVEIEEIENKRREMNENRRALRQAQAQLAQLEAQRELARAQDLTAAIHAKKANKPDPGTKNEDRLEKKITAAQREANVLQGLQVDLEQEAWEIMREHAHEITQTLSANLRRVNEAQLGAISQLENARSQRQQMLRTLEQVEGFAPVETVEDQGPGQDYVELGGIHHTGSVRQIDDHDIMKVMAQLKAEAGDDAELQSIAEQEQGTADLFAPGPSVMRMTAGRQEFERRKAERLAERAGAEVG
jgi:hypothetical protein